MNTIYIEKYGTDLSSRLTGSKLREEVLSLAGKGAVVLDFKGVHSISHSFADEFLAVLVEDKGESWFRENVQVINHSPIVRWTILDAIKHRLTKPGHAA